MGIDNNNLIFIFIFLKNMKNVGGGRVLVLVESFVSVWVGVAPA